MVTARAFTQYRIPLFYYQSDHLFSDHAIITLLLAQPQRIQMPLHFKKRFFFFFSWQSSHCCRFGWSRRLVIPISCHLILSPYVTPNSIECQYFIAGGRAVGIYSFLVGRSQFLYCFQCKDKPFSTLKGMKNDHSGRDSFGCQVWQVFRYSYRIVDGVGVEYGRCAGPPLHKTFLSWSRQ